MDLLDTVKAAVVTAGVRLINPVSPTGLASYLGAFAFFVAMAIVMRRRLPRWRSFWRAAFPSKILNHVSTALDLKLYVANWLVLPSAYGVAIIGGNFWAEGTRRAATAIFGAHEGLAAPSWAVIAITTIVEVLAIDLGYWGGHYLDAPHSGLVGIPQSPPLGRSDDAADRAAATSCRNDPHAECDLARRRSRQRRPDLPFRPSARAIGLQQQHLAGDVFLTISHLRHSHVWLPFTGLVGRVLHSPAHHQIHHSTDPKHFDKNLGFAMSV
jgi:sterol desaturase/sphingolipid hydroxylase (fatty acid hydroxylase superfamily)